MTEHVGERESPNFQEIESSMATTEINDTGDIGTGDTEDAGERESPNFQEIESSSASDKTTEVLNQALGSVINGVIPLIQMTWNKKQDLKPAPAPERKSLDKIKEEYFGLEALRSRLFNDIGIAGYATSAVNDIFKMSFDITSACKIGPDKSNSQPILMKYYETVFLPSLGVTREELIDGSVTLAKVRSIMPKSSEESFLTTGNMDFIREPFDSSDFLDWDRDKEIYEKHGMITRTEYSKFVQGDITKENLRFVLRTIPRFSQYIDCGSLKSRALCIAVTLVMIVKLKPKTLKEVKELLNPFLSSSIQTPEQTPDSANSASLLSQFGKIFDEGSGISQLLKSFKTTFVSEPVVELDEDFWNDLLTPK